MTDPDRPCPHEDFLSTVEVVRLCKEEGAPVEGYQANILIHCAQCDEPFRFVGMQAGVKGDRPMCSVDETELRAPIRPASSDPDFGLGIPGFAIGVGSEMCHVDRRDCVVGMDTSDPDDHGVGPRHEL